MGVDKFRICDIWVRDWGKEKIDKEGEEREKWIRNECLDGKKKNMELNE